MKRIGMTSLKDFARRDFFVSNVLTAVLFTAALLLFPTGAKTQNPQTTALVADSSR